MPMRFIYPALFAAGVLFTPSGAYAIEFKSVADEITVLYDAPTTQSTKRLILTRGYPVEVIIASDGWVRTWSFDGDALLARARQRRAVMQQHR